MSTPTGPPSERPADREALVTAEAVVLDLPTAGLASRLVARAVDALVQVAVLGALSLVVSVVVLVSEVTGVVVLVVGAFSILLLYPVVLESLWQGRTVGKAAFGLRVVTVDGGPVRLHHAAVRGFIGIVDVFLVPIGVIGVVTMLLNRCVQRLGDLAAGTYVVRERGGQAAFPVWFSPPPGLDPFVASLDVATLGPAQYQLVRSYLLRVRELGVAPRAELGERIAARLSQQVRRPIPSGMPAELFCLCVAAAYQRRHGLAAAALPVPPPTGQ
jgi:uncharacterized RDD family membrane protein YckC